MFSQVVAICLLTHLYAVESEELCQHNSTRGRDYKGTSNATKTGNLCQKWSDYYDVTRPGDHNFCRNPAGSNTDQVWCHTNGSDQGWENCAVPFCPPLKVLDFSFDNDDLVDDEGECKSSNRKSAVLIRHLWCFHG